MTPEAQQQQDPQQPVDPAQQDQQPPKKKTSYAWPIALGALGAGTALAGGLLISPRMRAAAKTFIGADNKINTNLQSDPVKDLNTYVTGGSDMASGKIMGVLPVPSFMKGVRLSQFTPEQWRYWNPDTASHYNDFANGPASGYFRFLQEHVDSEKDYHTGRSLIPSLFNPTWWAKHKIEGLPGGDKHLADGATDTLLQNIQGMKGKYDPTVVAQQLQNRFKELAGVDDISKVTLDQQRQLFPRFDDYVKKVDPNLWKQKYLTDFTQGASRIPSSLNSYVDLVKPVMGAQNALVGGGAAIAGAGGIWAIIKARRAAQAEEQRKQQMLKGAAISINPEHKGWLHKDLGVEGDEKIPLDKEKEALKSPDPAVRRRAQFAINARSWKHNGDDVLVVKGLAGIKTAALPKNFKLVFYKNRSTPQVVKADEETSPKTGYGEIVGKRDATPKEVATIMKGRWLRKDEQDNDPKSKDYKKTKMRPHLIKQKDAGVDDPYNTFTKAVDSNKQYDTPPSIMAQTPTSIPPATKSVLSPKPTPLDHANEIATEASHAADKVENTIKYVPKAIGAVSKFTTPVTEAAAEGSSIVSGIETAAKTSTPFLKGMSNVVGTIAKPLAVGSLALEGASLASNPEKAMDDVHSHNDEPFYQRAWEGNKSPLKTIYTGAVDTNKMFGALDEQNKAETSLRNTQATLSKTRAGQIGLANATPLPDMNLGQHATKVPSHNAPHIGFRNFNTESGISDLPHQSALPGGSKVASIMELLASMDQLQEVFMGPLPHHLEARWREHSGDLHLDCSA